MPGADARLVRRQLAHCVEEAADGAVDQGSDEMMGTEDRGHALCVQHVGERQGLVDQSSRCVEVPVDDGHVRPDEVHLPLP